MNRHLDLEAINALPGIVAKLCDEVRQLREQLGAVQRAGGGGDDPLITVDEAARISGRTRAAVYKLLSGGKGRKQHLHPVKVGRAVRLRRSEVLGLVVAK